LPALASSCWHIRELFFSLSGMLLLTSHVYWARYFSAREHSTQASRIATPSGSVLFQIVASPDLPLPTDVLLEAITATLIICLSFVSGSPQLRPIRWRVWAGKLEREGPRGFIGSIDSGNQPSFVGNPFRMLETRPGFVDIRHQRKDFFQWAKAESSISA